ncbi:MAG: hypothetical protein QY325_09055 [Flavobacteriales bacterium]|nr:MAG: hypothetical protein QY325_09055 [Flavobacteriales bacterium]
MARRWHSTAWLAVHFALAGWLLTSGARAQSEEDALRMATSRPGGTARSNGMGNAFGALGADPVAAGINPAGMALYRASSLSLTLGVDVIGDAATYYGTGSSATASRLSLPNLALVVHNPGKADGAMVASVYGIVYDRIELQRFSTDALADRAPTTMLAHFVNQADGIPYTTLPDDLPFGAGLAWNAFGIDTLPGSTDAYFSYIPMGSDTRQRHTVEANGATNRTGIFYAANIDDRIYIGATANIMGHRFRRTTTHTEYSLDQGLDLGQMEFREELVTSGGGFELLVGVIGRFSDRVRAGVAFQSPQWMQLNDAFNTSVRTGFRSTQGLDDYDLTYESPDGSFSYRINTPWRATASAAYIAGANGLVSIDYSYGDTRSLRFGRSATLDDPYDFALENAAIKDRFRAQHSVRIGTEWRAGSWYYRGGWGFVQDPYVTTDAQRGTARRTYAAGIGYRGAHVTVDLAANYTVQDLRKFAYDPALVEPMLVRRGVVSTFLTLGLRP